MPNLKRLCIFLRHGECNYDPNIYQSQNDIYLTPRGRKEIVLIANKIKIFKPQIIYVSPVFRTIQSAEIISQTIKTNVVVNNDLKERSFQSLANMPYSVIEKIYTKKFVRTLLTNSDKINIPGEETLIQAQKRVTNCLNFIMDQKHETVLVISHGGPHSWLCCSYFGLSVKSNRFFQLATGHSSLFEFNEEGFFKSIITLNNPFPDSFYRSYRT